MSKVYFIVVLGADRVKKAIQVHSFVFKTTGTTFIASVSKPQELLRLPEYWSLYEQHVGTMHHLPAWVRRFFESFPWTLQRLQAFIQSACFGEHTSEPDVEHDETGTIVDLGIISEDEEIPDAAVAEHKNVVDRVI